MSLSTLETTIKPLMNLMWPHFLLVPFSILCTLLMKLAFFLVHLTIHFEYMDSFQWEFSGYIWPLFANFFLE